MASNLLSPSLPRSAEESTVARWRTLRGVRLRELLGVSAGAAILDRRVRNSLEHIDEKLDEWLLATPRLTVEDVDAGRFPAHPAKPAAPLRIVRARDGVIAFRDVEIDASAVATWSARRLAPNPNGLGQRYWDGSQWTEHTAPA